MNPSNSKKHYKIYRAIKKYGKNNFYYEILEKNVPEDIINKREIYWIKYYNSFKNGYNSNIGGRGRTIYKNININYIIQELKKGKQVKELAKEFNINACTINRALKRYGINKSTNIQNTKIAFGKAQKRVSRKKVKELYNSKYTNKEIKNILGCDEKTVRRIKKELGIKLDRPRYDYSKINNNDIINDKLNSMKVKDILKKYNISYGYYYKIWKDYKDKNKKHLKEKLGFLMDKEFTEDDWESQVKYFKEQGCQLF